MNLRSKVSEKISKKTASLIGMPIILYPIFIGSVYFGKIVNGWQILEYIKRR